MNRSFSDPTGGALKFIYIHNPFYLISACLVLYGLRQAFAADGSLTGGWLMLGLMCGYTLLLAVTGYVVIQFGRVWQDARMILLVTVLLLQALPINFEEYALSHPLAGAGFQLIGFLFAVVVSEGLLYSLKMRLAVMYRLPYYGILALLYFYPIPLAHWSLEGSNALMTWGVFLFPAVAATIFLTLLVAVHRGGPQEPPNGTPWRWPWYPWSLFVVLALGTALRSFELSRSFEPAGGLCAAWQPYFLAPLLLVASLLLMELGIIHGSHRVRSIALALPLVLLLFAFPGAGAKPLQMRFLEMLCDSVGGPARLTVLALAVFYLLAWCRKVRRAEGGLIACLLLSSVIDHQTVDLETLASPRMAPIWAVAGLQITLGLVRRSSWRWLVGCLLAVAATTYWLRNTWLAGYGGYVPLHVGVVLLLAAGLLFRDRFARALATSAPLAVAVLAAFAASMYERLFPEVPGWVHLQYIAVVTTFGFLYWYRAAQLHYLTGALLAAASYCLAAARQVYSLLQGAGIEKGLSWLMWGMAFLGLAVLISFIKGGVIQKVWASLHQLNDFVRRCRIGS